MVVDTVLGHREEQIVERAVLVEPVAAEPELHEDLLYDVFGGGMFPPPDDSFREGQEEVVVTVEEGFIALQIVPFQKDDQLLVGDIGERPLHVRSGIVCRRGPARRAFGYRLSKNSKFFR